MSSSNVQSGTGNQPVLEQQKMESSELSDSKKSVTSDSEEDSVRKRKEENKCDRKKRRQKKPRKKSKRRKPNQL